MRILFNHRIWEEFRRIVTKYSIVKYYSDGRQSHMVASGATETLESLLFLIYI